MKKFFVGLGAVLAAFVVAGTAEAQYPAPIQYNAAPLRVSAEPIRVLTAPVVVQPVATAVVVAPVVVSPAVMHDVGVAPLVGAVPVTVVPINNNVAANKRRWFWQKRKTASVAPVVVESSSVTTTSTTTFTPGPSWRAPGYDGPVGASTLPPVPARKSTSWSTSWSQSHKETSSSVWQAPAMTQTGQGGTVQTVTTTTSASYTKTVPQRGSFGGGGAPRRNDVLVIPPDVSWPGPR